MPWKAGEGFVDLGMDDSKLRRVGARVQRTLKRVQQRMERVGRVARNMLLVGAGLGAYFVKQASDAEEIASKFDAVFKEEAKAAEDFGDRLAGAVGRSRVEMQAFLATLQDTFVPLGFARKEAREMSQRMVKLAIDLASFNNVADADALRDLQSAIVGNHETMRKYGVIITQGVLDQQLLAMGYKKVSKGATEQQKALARLELILKGTTDAQGDAVRTAGSFANQMRALRSSVKDLAVRIGQTLIPTVKKWIERLRSLTESIGTLTQNEIKKLIEGIKTVGKVLLVVWLAPKVMLAIRGFIHAIMAVVRVIRLMRTAMILSAGATSLLMAGLAAVTLAVTLMIAKVLQLKQETWRITISTRTFARAMKDLTKAEREYAKAETLEDKQTAMENIVGLRERIVELLQDELDEMQDVDEHHRQSARRRLEVWERQLKEARDRLELIKAEAKAKSKAREEGQRGVDTEAERKKKKAAETATARMIELLGQLRVLQGAITKEELEIFHLRKLGIADDKLQRIYGLLVHIREIKKKTERDEERAQKRKEREEELKGFAERVKENLKTAVDHFRDFRDQLDEILTAGLITRVEYLRALQQKFKELMPGAVKKPEPVQAQFVSLGQMWRRMAQAGLGGRGTAEERAADAGEKSLRVEQKQLRVQQDLKQELQQTREAILNQGPRLAVVGRP